MTFDIIYVIVILKTYQYVPIQNNEFSIPDIAIIQFRKSFKEKYYI